MAMYCWKCGQELTDGASACVYCSANQRRPEPASEAGKAMRQLYDRYGRDTLLTNNLMLVNGLGDNVLARADERLSFSNLTFPHQLMRVICAEAVYRAFTIIKGTKYHK